MSAPVRPVPAPAPALALAAALASVAALALAAPRAARADDTGLALLRVEAFGGAHDAGYSTVGGGTSAFGGGLLSLALPAPGPVGAQADLLVGRFSSGERTWIGAGRAWVRGGDGLLGLGYAHTDVAGIASDQLALLAERYETPWLSVSATVGREWKSFPEDLYFAELFLHLYPGDRLAIATGVSYAQATIKQTRADVVTRLDWVAWAAPSHGLTLYLQYGGNLLTKASAGLVLTFDGLTPAVRERTRGLWSGRLR